MLWAISHMLHLSDWLLLKDLMVDDVLEVRLVCLRTWRKLEYFWMVPDLWVFKVIIVYEVLRHLGWIAVEVDEVSSEAGAGLVIERTRLERMWTSLSGIVGGTADAGWHLVFLLARKQWVAIRRPSAEAAVLTWNVVVPILSLLPRPRPICWKLFYLETRQAFISHLRICNLSRTFWYNLLVHRFIFEFNKFMLIRSN